jgi:hypothetical protein
VISRRRRLVLLLLGAALVPAGCARPVVIGDEVLACESGDDGTPAQGVVLMAQSVPTAAYVPCLESMPVGWHVADVQARNDVASFSLDSDRDGVRALEIRLTGGCDTSGASEIPSDRPEMRRLEEVSSVTPQYVGRRYYVFDGGCITVHFRLAGRHATEPLAVATQSVGTLPRDALRAHVREETDGRLELDPGGRP